MSLRPGDTVEHFQIVSSLGEGGMGQVYVARDTRLQRMVALKIVHPAKEGSLASEGSAGAARLLREAQSAAALEHPNVVTVYEVGEVRSDGEEAGRPFIAMELVKGRALRAFVGDASVPIGLRVRWLADIARALGAAHRAGLVHRDVKPENVMVRDDGVVKVLDFGVAKRAAVPSVSTSTSTEAQVLPSLTAKGVAVGTPYYMAPEQMRREGLDGRADQFSWGVVAYELLAGVPPWGRDVDALELVSKLLTETPRPLREACPDVPAQVVDVVARAMAKRRDDRFASMEEVVTALGRLDGPLEASAPRVSIRPSEAENSAAPHATTAIGPAPSAAGWPRRRPLLAAAVGLALAASVAWVAMGRRASSAGKDATSTGTSSAPPARECQRQTECVAQMGGKPAVCSPAGKCSLVETSECKAYYEAEDLKRDDTVWIGGMFPTVGEGSEYGIGEMNAVELGRRDFAHAFQELKNSGSGARPLALVGCNDSVSAHETAVHLVSEMGVPAVLGTSPQKTLELATSVFVPSGTLLVDTLSSSILLSRVPHARGQPRLVWRTTYSHAETSRALAALVGEREATVRRAARLSAGEPLRVALVRARSAGNDALAEALFGFLRFNGHSALENGDAYREFAFERANARDDYSGVLPKLVAFAPNVVLFLTDSGLVPAIESAWPSSTARPYYFEPYVVDRALIAALGSDAALRRRVLGLTSVSSTQTNARFVLHYNETFGDQITRSLAHNSSYDAFYMVAYAVYASGPGAIDGRKLSGAMARLLPPGESVDVGPSEIIGAAWSLARGANIDLGRDSSPARCAVGEVEGSNHTGPPCRGAPQLLPEQPGSQYITPSPAGTGNPHSSPPPG